MSTQLLPFFKSFESKNYFLSWYDNQPASAKAGFFSAAIIALLTHMIIYSNLILEIHLARLQLPREISLHSGRWFPGHLYGLTFHYLNWANGLLQVLFFALTVFFFVKAFDIKSRVNAILIAGVMVTFPVVAETNLHFHDAAPYFFAVFVSVAAFYAAKLHKHGWVAGVPLIVLSLALYQSKISLAMVMVIFHLIIYLMKNNPGFAELAKYAARYVLLIGAGLLAYAASLRVLNVSPHYRGMDDLSFSAADIWRAYTEVHYYFFSNRFFIDNAFLTASFWIIALMCLVTLFAVVKSAPATRVSNVVFVCVLVLLLPMAANFSRVFDREASYVLAMVTYAFALFLVLPLILYENFKINTFGLKNILVAALIFVIGYNVSFSNYIYLRGQAITARVLHFSNRVAARVEPLLPYADNNHVLLIGNVIYNPLYPHMTDFTEYTPRTNTVLLWGHTNVNSWPRDFLGDIIRYRIGLNVNHVTGGVFGGYGMKMDRARRYLKDRAITYGMPVWPQEGSVALIEGVVVGMLQFYGRLDVEGDGVFSATANHTGKASDLEFEYAWYLYRVDNNLKCLGLQIATENTGQISQEIFDPGSYRFRVYLRFADGENIIDFFSPVFEVQP